jgi:hypothetical protein
MNTFLKKCTISATAIAVLLVAGCTQQSAPPTNNAPVAAKKPAGPPELVTAKTAFWPMYTSARSWAPDIVVLRVTAKALPGFKNEAGKAAMWEATFASSSKRESRIYSYAITDIPPDIYKGVAAGIVAPWGGVTRDAMPVDLSLFNVDSDAAYQAVAAGAADWIKKNPGKGLSDLELGDTYRFQVPVWYLMWGDKTSGYVALVDASSGKLLKH